MGTFLCYLNKCDHCSLTSEPSVDVPAFSVFSHSNDMFGIELLQNFFHLLYVGMFY